MKTLITMTMSVKVEGDDFHICDQTETHGNEWSDVYRGMVMLRDELNRQISERKLCPFNPMNIRRDGNPEFSD